MWVYEIRDAFGLDHLKRSERPDPEPRPGQVVVQVAATSLNYRDWLLVQGVYNPRQRLPLIPLSDGVGRVVAIGAGVQRVAVGDRVAGTFFQGWISGQPTRERMRDTLGAPLDGMLAQQVVLSEEGVVRVPEHLSDEQAATLPCAALTAWNALISEGRLQAGQTVLVQGTGGVSLFALQIAKMSGAGVIVTSSSDAKLEKARALGADHGINYRSTPDWGKRALELTGGLGVDHVIEVGGAGTIDQSLIAVRPGGAIAVIGVLAGVQKELNLNRILMRHIRLQGILVGHREAFEAMNRAFAMAKVVPVVDRVFPFEQAVEAFRALAAGQHFGKIAIRVGAP